MEDSSPRIVTTVVIVSRNSIDQLRRCIRAVEASKERGTIQLIVVDSGSRDGSASVDSEFPAVTMLRLPRHFGATKARNIAARSATGEFVLFLSPAVEVAPDTIQQLIQAVVPAGDAGAASAFLVTPEGAPALLFGPLPRPGQSPPPVAPLAAATGNTAVEYVEAAALLLRRDFLRGMNYLDERYGDFGSDYEICRQIASAGRRIVVVGDARGVRHGLALPGGREAGYIEADRILGTAAFLGKHHGAAVEVKMRLAAALGALGSSLSLSEGSRKRARFLALVTGQKIDGTQPGS